MSFEVRHKRKVCKGCGCMKPETAFGTRGTRNGKPVYKARCLDCGTSERQRAASVAYKRKTTLGVVEELRASPCGICGRSATADTPSHVDHDHATDKIRGSLCVGCNTGLGKLGDSVAGLERAIRYLDTRVPVSTLVESWAS